MEHAFKGQLTSFESLLVFVSQNRKLNKRNHFKQIVIAPANQMIDIYKWNVV